MLQCFLLEWLEMNDEERLRNKRKLTEQTEMNLISVCSVNFRLFRNLSSRLIDLFVFVAGLAILYFVLVIGRTWLGPPIPHAQVSRSPSALPAYAAYSLLRLAIAYALSLVFALVYGYIAA